MKYRQPGILLPVIILLLLAACGNGTRAVSSHTTHIPSRIAPVKQQPLPKRLLNPHYPVMDWVYNITCGQAINSYNNNSLDTALAYDSAAWLYPGDGHLVEGWQDCDQSALLQRARNQQFPTLLTVGVDSYWSDKDLAQYIDRAASQPQVPCTAQATTFICAIVNWASAGGYTGVIIDFEIVKGDYPGIRMKFARFMQELQKALHQKGLLCGIALIHKVGDTPAEDPSFNGNYFEDWQLLGGMDFLVAMVLDFDLSVGRPGPLTSIPWVDQQLDYIWQTIPQALSKTIFEFPLYGREWRQDASGKWHPLNDETCQQVTTQQAAHHLLSEVNTDPSTPEMAWNDASGNRHEVWYDTASSLVAIMTHLQQKARALLNNFSYKLPASFWYRGAECPHFFGPGSALAKFYND